MPTAYEEQDYARLIARLKDYVAYHEGDNPELGRPLDPMVAIAAWFESNGMPKAAILIGEAQQYYV